MVSSHGTDPPPLVPSESQRTCAPPEEELLVDSGFDNGDEEVVGYMSLSGWTQATLGNDDWSGGDGSGSRNKISCIYGEGPRSTC